MAERARLSVRPSIRFAALVAMVVALHAWVLQWLGHTLEAPGAMKPMAAPMFTRLLQPEAPPVIEATAKPPPPKKRTTMAAMPAPVATPAAKAASAPAPEVPAPDLPPPETSASAPAAAPPEVAASAADAASAAEAPLAAASAPASPASAAVSAGTDTWPADTRLSYRLTGWYRGEFGGSARVQWLRQDERYEARVDLNLGLFGMQFLSQGEISGDTLAPRVYQESRPNRTRSVRLNPDSVVLNDGRSVARPAGVQDTASHFIELSHRFSTGQEQLVVGGTTSVWLARPGGVDLWTYDIVGRDPLETPRLGVVDAFHLRPRPIRDARGDIYVEIWLAPALQYLPVRIRINQGTESWVDILVDRIEQR